MSGWSVPVELLGDDRDETDVLRHVLPDDAVTPGGRRHQHAALIAQVDGETVDLELAEVVDAAAGVALDLGRPEFELLDREHVVETEHALGVLNGVEQGRVRSSTDGQGRAVLALHGREAGAPAPRVSCTNASYSWSEWIAASRS